MGTVVGNEEVGPGRHDLLPDSQRPSVGTARASRLAIGRRRPSVACIVALRRPSTHASSAVAEIPLAVAMALLLPRLA